MKRKIKNLLSHTAFAVALLAVAVAVAAEGGIIVTERPDAASSASQRPTPKIKVRGKVTGLHPGAVKKMRVTVRNRFPRRVFLISVRARVGDASPTCTGTNIRVKRFRSRRAIPSGSRRKVRMRVKMRPSAPDACQGTRFPIGFRAKVTR